MNQLTNIIGLLSIGLYIMAIIGAVTLPLWGYQLLEKKLLPKHKALRVTRTGGNCNKENTTSILASIGTTTAGVFLIQILPLLFSIINDIGGSFGVNTVYANHLHGMGMGDYVDDFYALAAQLGDITQTVAPMAAVGLGGYNLLNKLARGLPA